MKKYASNSLAEIYKNLYNDILGAEEIAPRGLKTKEIIGAEILLTDPRSRIAKNSNRGWSTLYALVESLMIFDKTSKLKYFSEFNKNIANFSDDGIHLYGSYGYRIANYIEPIVSKLENDPYSRQVALPILRIEDVIKETKDIPCTLNLQFLLRDNKLNMIVNMRSNDIIWGLPYDLFVFTNMQEVVANTLGVELGWYLHRPGSLHLYKKHYDLFKEVGNNFSNVRIKNPMDMINWVEVKDDYKDFVNGKGNGEKFNKVYSSIKSDWIVEND